jgi:YVTN family beta-propeller protein
MTRITLLGLVLLGAFTFACSSDHESNGDESQSRGERVFATVASSAEVLVLDAATHEQIASVPVGAGPAIILATKDGKRLYTADWADNSITSIDADTLQPTVLPMPGRPYVIALSPDDERLYVGLASVNGIAVIDTATNTVLNTFEQSELPASIIVSPDGKTLYVAFLGLFFEAGKLVALDAETGAEKHPVIPVGYTPAWITIGKDGSRVYTLDFLSDDISVVDTETWSVVKTLTTATGSQGIIGNVTPDGSRLYVTNHGTGELIGIDTSSNEIVQTIKLDGEPVGVNFTADGSHVWTTDFGVGSIGEDLNIGLTYLLSGVYNGTNRGQLREFDIASGNAVGTTVATSPGATSIVVVGGPGAKP